jgi:hypothetical protein
LDEVLVPNSIWIFLIIFNFIPMFIHPSIIKFQKRFNHIYNQFEVENDVRCFVNLSIYYTNLHINLTYKELISDLLNQTNEEICDWIYNHFNISKGWK